MPSDTPTPRTQLRPGDLTPGEPLPLDVFDANGLMLLARGQVVRSESQLERLLEIGLWGDADHVARLRNEPLATEPQSLDRQQASVFEWLASARDELDAALTAADADLVARLGDVARQVRRAVALDSDAAVATVQWIRQGPYAVRQSVNVAVLAELMLVNMEAPDHVRHATVAAALSMNLSIVALQETLYHQKEMSPEQKAEVVRHPVAAFDRLRGAGLADETWLRAVLEHHEAFDGSGYPRKLQGEDIGLPARVISVADKFCATVSERAYRGAVPVSIALRKLLTASGPTMDPQVAARLAREIGIFPPGTPVRLRNGETGVAIKRTLDPLAPVVRVVRGRFGEPLATFTKRLTSRDTFGVAEEVARDELGADFDVFQLWNPSIDRTDP
ncbi:MAG: HD domain-containing protein [Betaproteobacteria bacterium]|nr:HD domain-containing protein [Betaproteobacteria bacterium]